jgi:hypothetical protein
LLKLSPLAPFAGWRRWSLFKACDLHCLPGRLWRA